jgi:hypothetical protein
MTIDWIPIEREPPPKGEPLLLWFPPVFRGHQFRMPPMIREDRWPVATLRQPTHWARGNPPDAARQALARAEEREGEMGEYVVQYPLKVLLANAINGSGEPMNPPAGLYLTCGDGVAVEVTKKMFDRALDAALCESGRPEKLIPGLVKFLIQQAQDPSNV